MRSPGSFATSLGDVGADGVYIHGVKGLAGGHEQAVAACASEADVGAVFGQADHADRFATRCDHLDAGRRAGPNVTVDIAANAIGGASGELDKTLAIAQRFAIEIVDPDLAAGAGVADVHLLVIRRKADAVGLVEIVGHLVHLSGLSHPRDTRLP